MPLTLDEMNARLRQGSGGQTRLRQGPQQTPAPRGGLSLDAMNRRLAETARPEPPSFPARPPQPPEAGGGLVDALVGVERIMAEELLAAAQRTSPITEVTSTEPEFVGPVNEARPVRRTRPRYRKLGRAVKLDQGFGYVDPEGKARFFDPARQVILSDPDAPGEYAVFARSPETEESIPSALGRILGVGVLTDPVTRLPGGAARASRAARAASRSERIEPTLDVPPIRPEPAPTAGATAEPPPPAPPKPTPPVERVVTPSGRAVDVAPEVVEADTLVTSHTDALQPNPDFPQALQPRQRTRAASQAQVADIAANLEPELLGRSAGAAEGAPIVGGDNLVESGNARVLALRRAYERGLPGATRYRDFLEKQGFDTTGMKEPVLVRRRTTDLTPEARRAFVVEANTRTTLAPGAAEQAASDAAAMPDALADLYRGGPVTAAVNRAFVRRFVEAAIPTAERGAVLDAGGALSQAGARRIENALFAKAYGDTGLLAGLRESQDTNIKAIGEAMMDTAPSWLRLRADVAAGRVRPEMDITGAVVEAAETVSRARRQGMPLADLVNQPGLFGDLSDAARGVLRLMFRDPNFRRPVSRPKLAAALTRYADQARQVQAGAGLDLGDAPVTPTAILDTIASGDGLPGVAARTPDAELPETVFSGPGERHVGPAPDRPNLDMPRRKTVIRRNTILRDLAEGLGVPIYTNRIKGNKVLGFFRKPIEEVRIRHYDDIETAAHEIGHLLDHRFPALRALWTNRANTAIRDELRGVSYDRSKLHEGWAEFVRLWMTQQDEAQARAPEVFAAFEEFVQRSPAGPALRRAQEQMHDWFAQNALDRARSKIGAQRDIMGGIKDAWRGLRQSTLDDLDGLAQMERTLTGELPVGGAYETARLARASASITEGALLYGAPKVMADGSHTFVGKGLKDILDPVADRLDDFLLYAVGRSAGELMGQGREHLFTAAEIRAMKGLETPAFRQAFAEYQDWNRAVLDFAQAKGVINSSARAMFQRAQYLPFHRIGNAPGARFAAMPGAWKGVQALTGGTGNIRDVLQNIIMNAHTLIDAGLTNEARIKIANLARGEGGARYMAKIPTEERAVRVERAQIEQAIREALGIGGVTRLEPEQQKLLDAIIGNLDAFTAFLLRGQAPTGGPFGEGSGVVAVLRGGKPEYWEVADPLVYRSLMALKRPVPPWITRVLFAPVKRLGQLGITLDPSFVAANLFRDTISGAVFSKHGFRPFLDSAKGFVSRLRADETYKAFIANGGGLSSHLLDEQNYRARLERFYTGHGIDYRSVIDSPRKLFDGLARIAESAEMATRLGEYQRAIRAGEHPRAAAFAAREVSTDFAMRGDSQWLGFLYDSVIFLKAAAVGLDRAYRGFVRDPHRLTVAYKAGLLALASAGLYLLNRGNPLYEDLPDWDRDTHWHLFVPTPEALRAAAAGEPLPPVKDAYIHLRFPKIWEVGAMATIAERELEGILDDQPTQAHRNALRAVGAVFDVGVVPQAFAPLLEVWANRDIFFNRPIENRGQQSLAPWARSGLYTSPTVRAVGEATRHLPRSLQLSPEKMQHLIEGYFGLFGTYGLSLTDAALFDDRPDLPLSRYPVLRRFLGRTGSTRHVDELYDMLAAATEARRTMREMIRRGRPALALEQRARPENRLYTPLGRAADRMAAFRRRMDRVTRAPSLAAVREIAQAHEAVSPGLVREAKAAGAWSDTGALKRFLLDALVRERNAFAKRVMQRVEQARGGARAARSPQGEGGLTVEQMDRRLRGARGDRGQAR